jgi:hypothetical protein
MTGTRMEPAALSYLISLHAAVDPSPCRECGTEMTISEVKNGVVTYHCGAVSPLGDKAAQVHWRRSEQVIAYHGDQRIVRALHELRDLRAAAGEDMAVPDGELFFPHGHGKNHCYRYFQHLGKDVWAERIDIGYLHDPSHADLASA